MREDQVPTHVMILTSSSMCFLRALDGSDDYQIGIEFYDKRHAHLGLDIRERGKRVAKLSSLVPAGTPFRVSGKRCIAVRLTKEFVAESMPNHKPKGKAKERKVHDLKAHKTAFKLGVSVEEAIAAITAEDAKRDAEGSLK